MENYIYGSYLGIVDTKNYWKALKVSLLTYAVNRIIKPFTAKQQILKNARGLFRFPYGSPATFAHIWLNKADCELFILLWKSRCPLLVCYCENFIAECIFYAPCFSFFRKPKAPSIASATLACAVWNWWQYTFKVVDEQQCPNAPETVVTSSPAEINELAAKWRKLCRP